eukprot:718947-Prymnesium_polylepis.1
MWRSSALPLDAVIERPPAIWVGHPGSTSSAVGQIIQSMWRGIAPQAVGAPRGEQRSPDAAGGWLYSPQRDSLFPWEYTARGGTRRCTENIPCAAWPMADVVARG